VPINSKSSDIPFKQDNLYVVIKGSILALIILLVLVGLVVFFVIFASMWILSELVTGLTVCCMVSR